MFAHINGNDNPTYFLKRINLVNTFLHDVFHGEFKPDLVVEENNYDCDHLQPQPSTQLRGLEKIWCTEDARKSYINPR